MFILGLINGDPSTFQKLSWAAWIGILVILALITAVVVCLCNKKRSIIKEKTDQVELVEVS